ncbi:MAG: HNH endonuclease signature motif containing protein [Chloroflexota bacterium]
MSYISESLRRTVIQRANSCCEYCLIHQENSLYTHEVDHIIPRKHRGKTSADNLCLACLECNRYKGSDFGSFDPQTDEITQLYHPRKHQWLDHFVLDQARIKPLTAIGRVTVFVLRLNDEERIQDRNFLRISGSYPPSILNFY